MIQKLNWQDYAVFIHYLMKIASNYGKKNFMITWKKEKKERKFDNFFRKMHHLPCASTGQALIQCEMNAPVSQVLTWQILTERKKKKEKEKSNSWIRIRCYRVTWSDDDDVLLHETSTVWQMSLFARHASRIFHHGATWLQNSLLPSFSSSSSLSSFCFIIIIFLMGRSFHLKLYKYTHRTWDLL